MPLVARKEMVLVDKPFARGDVVPTKVWKAIDPLRQNQLLRVGLVEEVADAPKSGEGCPVCGKGPYARLAQHISLVHPDQGQEEPGTPNDTEQEEPDKEN